MEKISTLVNGDFSLKAMVDINSLGWIPSPMAGVNRKPLDRVGGEVARATSVVQYLAGHSFPAHRHDEGEEYFVVSGVFSDGSGNYGAGSYVRNPPGSSHAPFSDAGCEIFVKLRQMKAEHEPQITVDSEAMEWAAVSGRDGFFEKKLFEADGWYEKVSLEKITSECGVKLEVFGQAAEILVLSGELSDAGTVYGALSWIRYPKGGSALLSTSSEVVYWIKRGIEFPS